MLSFVAVVYSGSNAMLFLSRNPFVRFVRIMNFSQLVNDQQWCVCTGNAIPRIKSSSVQLSCV